jgi:hypothetical protein
MTDEELDQMCKDADEHVLAARGLLADIHRHIKKIREMKQNEQLKLQSDNLGGL